jgi:hypothetical protein
VASWRRVRCVCAAASAGPSTSCRRAASAVTSARHATPSAWWRGRRGSRPTCWRPWRIGSSCSPCPSA